MRRRFYAPQLSFAADGKSVTLSDDEARHARDVLRLGRGDEVFVFDGEGREYRCAIGELAKHSATLDVAEEVQPASPESPLDLTLAVALLKGEKFDLVVQKATELGVMRMSPLITARADVRIRDSADAKRKAERWSRIAFEAAKQCGRARLMLVDPPTDLDEFFRSITDVDFKLTYTARDGDAHGEAFQTELKHGWVGRRLDERRNHPGTQIWLENRHSRWAHTAGRNGGHHGCGALAASIWRP
jgi:RsmE family RNA methyltransferase